MQLLPAFDSCCLACQIRFSNFKCAACAQTAKADIEVELGYSVQHACLLLIMEAIILHLQPANMHITVQRYPYHLNFLTFDHLTSTIFDV